MNTARFGHAAWALLSFLSMLGASAPGATVNLVIGQNFTGSTLGQDSIDVPPDCNGAAGPNHFVELINGRYSVYDKSTGLRVQTLTDIGFWQQAGVTIFDGWEVSDPRLIYDPSVQRWFAAAIDFDPTESINTNRFLLAVSASADPRGGWNGVTIASDLLGLYFADFPTLGVDASGVYLSGNMFNSSGSAVGPTIVSIPKADLLAPIPSAQNRTFFSLLSYSLRGDVLQPASAFDGTSGGNVLGVGNLGLDGRTHSTLKGSTVLNAGGPGPATLSSSTTISVSSYSVPIDPIQPDGSNNLDDGDARFSAATYRVRGVLFAVHGTEVNSRAAIRWYRISATNYARLESGTISDPALDLFYPSIAANTNGTVVIGFNGSSIGTFVSSYAVAGQTVSGVTAFGPRLLLKSGLASYQRVQADGTSRWGDYSATSVDPADPTRFWTIQMYPSGSQTWSTQITELLTGPPRLTISRSDGNLLLCWTTSAAVFQLQCAPSLSPGTVWSNVVQTTFGNGNQTCVQVPASEAQYFRLIQTQ